MLNFIKNFGKDEDGAVTVDFVVLTAAIVLLGLAVGGALTTRTQELGQQIADTMGEVPEDGPVINTD